MPKEELRLHVAAPCPVRWESMVGDQRVRFCAICQKCVYNLSEMSLREGQKLVREREGGLCVRFYERADGTVMTSDCGFGLARAAEQLRRGMLRAAAAVLGLLGFVGGVAVFGDNLRRSFGATTGALPADPLPRPEHRPRHANVTRFAPIQDGSEEPCRSGE